MTAVKSSLKASGFTKSILNSPWFQYSFHYAVKEVIAKSLYFKWKLGNVFFPFRATANSDPSQQQLQII